MVNSVGNFFLFVEAFGNFFLFVEAVGGVPEPGKACLKAIHVDTSVYFPVFGPISVKSKTTAPVIALSTQNSSCRKYNVESLFFNVIPSQCCQCPHNHLAFTVRGSLNTLVTMGRGSV